MKVSSFISLFHGHMVMSRDQHAGQNRKISNKYHYNVTNLIHIHFHNHFIVSCESECVLSWLRYSDT
jgi:hypothetical protein